MKKGKTIHVKKHEMNATVVLELLSLEKKIAALKSNCLANNACSKRPLSRQKKNSLDEYFINTAPPTSKQ